MPETLVGQECMQRGRRKARLEIEKYDEDDADWQTTVICMH